MLFTIFVRLDFFLAAAFLWKNMQEETTVEDLVKAVVASYPEVDEATAKLAGEGCVQQLKENDMLLIQSFLLKEKDLTAIADERGIQYESAYQRVRRIKKEIR